MTKSAIYQFNHQFINMGKERVSQVFIDLEKSLRTGIFKYKNPSLSKKQYEEMKKNWSEDTIKFFKERALKLSGDKKLTPEIAFQASIETIFEFTIEERQKNAAVVLSKSTLLRKVYADMALSMMTDVAFDASNVADNPKIIAGKKIEIRYTLIANKFRIECDDVDGSDIFVFSLFNEQVDKAILIGWKSQSEVRACKRGNKNTDPSNCPWEKMSFHFTYPELNPMSDLATQFGLKELPEGMILEQITQLHYIPIPDNALTMNLSKKDTKAKDDYYKSLGIEEIVQPTSTKEERQTIKDDDWTM